MPGTTLGYDGKGVTVAFLADGLQVANPDFTRSRSFALGRRRRAGSRVITQYQDFSGDGTAARTPGGEAFLRRELHRRAGQPIYDLSHDVSPRAPPPVGLRHPDRRVRPRCVASTRSRSSRSATRPRARGSSRRSTRRSPTASNVINESFGGNRFPDTAADIVRAADEAAVAAGVTVVVSTGDAGITSSTIGSPATDPAVLAVGASTTFRALPAGHASAASTSPAQRDRYVDNNISSISSGGFAQDGKTVDLVAPGDLSWALCAAPRACTRTATASASSSPAARASPRRSPRARPPTSSRPTARRTTGRAPRPPSSGRSSRAPPRTSPPPRTSRVPGCSTSAAAVRLALSAPGHDRARRTGGVLASTTQVDLAGAPSHAVEPVGHAHQHRRRTRRTVALSTRALVPTRVSSGAIALDPSVRAHQPKFPIWSGAPEVYRTVDAHVAARRRAHPAAGRLRVHAARPRSLHVALFTPSGALAGYSNPQGIGDYADVEVARPAPGTWTAVFFTVWDGFHGDTRDLGARPVHVHRSSPSPRSAP